MRLIFSLLVGLLWLGGMAGCTISTSRNNGAATMAPYDSRSFRDNPHLQQAQDNGGVLILFGAFCALWAQNTGRNPWLWFFLGLFFSVVTVFFLLTKNADDNFERKQFGRTSIDVKRGTISGS